MCEQQISDCDSRWGTARSHVIRTPRRYGGRAAARSPGDPRRYGLDGVEKLAPFCSIASFRRRTANRPFDWPA
jgi:hypothetical protein